MNNKEREKVENYLRKVAPEHLEGFKNGWLYTDEQKINGSKYINIYSKGGSVNIVAVYRRSL